MSNQPILPKHEVVVSSVMCTEASVVFRVVEDYHPDAKPNAYEISIIGPSDRSDVVSFLERCQCTGDGVYVGIGNCGLSVQTYAGDEIEIAAQSFSVKQDDFNLAELNAVLDRVWKWYDMEHQSNTAARKRIHEAQQILAESARRVETKAASHAPDSTAGTLYSQQLSLIRRLRDALEN